MTEEPFYFEFLANVDSSITKIKLNYGYKIEEMTISEFQKLTALHK